jgi:hypothetical protein
MGYLEEKTRHDRLVTEVARLRFPYPSPEHPSHVTYTNEPTQRIGVNTGSSVVYPDIVVVDSSASNHVVMMGEVEMEATINQDHVRQWKTYSALKPPFFLFVPSHLVQETRRLLALNGVKPAGIRSYFSDPQDNLLITEV